MTSPLRRYISAFPRCTVTDSSCIAHHTNAPLGMRPPSAAMSPRRFTNFTASLPMYPHVSTANRVPHHNDACLLPQHPDPATIEHTLGLQPMPQRAGRSKLCCLRQWLSTQPSAVYTRCSPRAHVTPETRHFQDAIDSIEDLVFQLSRFNPALHLGSGGVWSSVWSFLRVTPRQPGPAVMAVQRRHSSRRIPGLALVNSRLHRQRRDRIPADCGHCDRSRPRCPFPWNDIRGYAAVDPDTHQPSSSIDSRAPA